MTIADLITDPPATDRGIATGWDDWKLVVEAALPHNYQMMVGYCQVGIGRVGYLVWHDITELVRGITWTRGADEFGGSPNAGEMTLTIVSENGQLSPWNQSTQSYQHMGIRIDPGLVIRVGIRSATDDTTGVDGWLPQFCGVVETWPTFTAGQYKEEYAEVTLSETISVLGGINENALSNVVGGGDTPTERIERLLEASRWPFGFVAGFEGPEITLQSTDMSANRLAECKLTADTAGCVFRSHRDGRALLAECAPLTDVHNASWDIAEFMHPSYRFSTFPGWLFGQGAARIVYDDSGPAQFLADSLTWVSDDEAMRNDVTVGAAGSEGDSSRHFHYEDRPSQIRYQRKPWSRFDYIPSSASETIALTRVLQLQSLRSRLTRRVESIMLDNRHRDIDTAALVSLDVGDRVWITDAREDVPGPGYTVGSFSIGTIRAMTHRITPTGSHGVYWDATFLIDAYVNQDNSLVPEPATPDYP